MWTEHYEKMWALTEKAEALVKDRIKGTRKGLPDQPNYLHSFRVRDLVIECHHNDDPDHDLFIAALLHDVIEDGGVTYQELEEMGFSARTIDLVRLCSHSLDINDTTERWINMVNKLVEAKNEDAWRIKLADLADNLTESKGLAPEKRKFMIEVKAPLLIELGRVNYSANYTLQKEVEKQRLDMEKQWKYVVTQWVEDFDYDGMCTNFKVLGSFEDKCDAMISALTSSESYIRDNLKTKSDWLPVGRDDEMRTSFSKPNKYNKVVFSRSASRKDTTGYNSSYVFIEVIEVPFDSKIDEQMFNTKDCGWDVSQFFDESTNKETKDLLFDLKQKRAKPEQCHLWKTEELSDGDLDNIFDILQTYSEDSHFSRRLVKCKQCEQLYIKEFYEKIDWVDGEDSQYVTYIPVKNAEEAETISKVGLWEFQTFSPRINRDWPKGKPRRIYWIGK